MISAVLARRYARALLGLSQRLGDLKETHQDLQGVAGIFESDPRVRRFFEAPNIARTEKEAFLARRWKPKLNRNVYGLLVLLLRRRRFDHLVAIAAEFHKLAEEAQGITRAIVRTVPGVDVMMSPGVQLEAVSLQQLVVALSRRSAGPEAPATADLEESIR